MRQGRRGSGAYVFSAGLAGLSVAGDIVYIPYVTNVSYWLLLFAYFTLLLAAAGR